MSEYSLCSNLFVSSKENSLCFSGSLCDLRFIISPELSMISCSVKGEGFLMFSYLRNLHTVIIVCATIRAESVDCLDLVIWDVFRLVTCRPAITADSCCYAGDVAASCSFEQMLLPPDCGPCRVFTTVCCLPFRLNTFFVFTDFGFT